MDERVRAAIGAVEVVHRDESLLVLYKPSGLPTTSPDPNEPTLVSVAHELDPGAPRLHPSSRLDAEVSGLVTFARTPNATQHLLDARSHGRYFRAYLGLTHGRFPNAQGELDFALGIDPRDARKRHVVPASAPGARQARTRYRVLCETALGSLVWLEPQTGRTHQLRVHAAHVGAPLLGDRAYGGAPRVVLDDGSVIAARRVMLCCHALAYPQLGAPGTLRFTRTPPEDFLRIAHALAGAGLDALLADALAASAFTR